MEIAEKMVLDSEQDRIILKRKMYAYYWRRWLEINAGTPYCAAFHLAYNLLRGLQPQRGFSPITNDVKLANGQHRMMGFRRAVADLKYVCQSPVHNELLPFVIAHEFNAGMKADLLAQCRDLVK